MRYRPSGCAVGQITLLVFSLLLLVSCAISTREDRFSILLQGLREDYGLPGITAAFVLP